MKSHGKICFTTQNFLTNSPNFKFSISNEADALNKNEKSTFSKQMTFDFPEKLNLDSLNSDKKSVCLTQTNKDKREIHLDLLDDNDGIEGSSRIKLETQSCKNIYNKSILRNSFSLIDPRIKFFIINPLPKNTWLKFELEKKPFEKKGFKVLMTDEKGEIILTVIKRPKKSYRLYVSKDEVNEGFLAKLKSNFFGTEYNAYDLSKKQVKKNPSQLRANLATITYVWLF
jgi:hypothetical protein